jgi:hypothetical protein
LEKAHNVALTDVVEAIRQGTLYDLFYSVVYDVTIGDIAYDLFRKFVAKGFDLTANGYAYAYKENNKLLTGRLAKPFRAIFSISIGEIDNLINQVENGWSFIERKFGQITLGETVAPYLEIMLTKALKMEYNYDVANDYKLTMSGNFAELADAIFGIRIWQLMNVGNVGKFLFGKGGILENMPVGHLAGYLTDLKALKATFKHTTVEHEYGGEWIITGAYEHPLDILCNDVTFGILYEQGANFKNGILLAYFGEVAVGEFLGGILKEGVWYKPDGELVPTHGAKNVVMNAVYGITIAQLLAKDFDPTTVMDEIYTGQLMNYYYCGEFKYSVIDTEIYRFCEDSEHFDDID